MAWTVIRRATELDNQKLDSAATRFAARHGIDTELANEPGRHDPIGAVTAAVGCDQKLKPLWARVVRRALGADADGIAYGTVGRSVAQ